MNIARRSWKFTGLFEAELLVELMLRYWQHPLAADQEFRQDLLNSAAEVLQTAATGERLMEDVPPKEMNLVAAVWYAEWSALTSGDDDPEAKRAAWLETVRKSLPSCFCSQNRLD